MKKLCPFKSLPDDMQVLLFELVESVAGESGLQKLETHIFKVKSLPVAILPSVSISTDSRDEQYAMDMIGESLPPVVVHGKKWIDGRHRVWALKQNGAAVVQSIDLQEILPHYPFEPAGILSSSILGEQIPSNQTCG